MNNILIIVTYFNGMIITLTWCHCSPAKTPARQCILVMGLKEDVDNICSTCDYGTQDGPNSVAPNCDCGTLGATAASVNQSCPITVRDFQVIEATVICIMITFNVECIELK